MATFIKQIEEDFEEYRSEYGHIKNIDKDEWAFNFWVLDKLYSEDTEIIEEKIVDYNDKGIDCYVWHEESKDLYLIQNKYFGENTKVSKDYVKNDFLIRAIGALEQGTYSRSPELQAIYSKNCQDEDFTVTFNLYVTNNISKDKDLIDWAQNYNQSQKNRTLNIYGLDDIEELYYNEPTVEKKSLTFTMSTINKGTMLNITDAYAMAQSIEAKYVLVPVFCLYELYRKAKIDRYPIFDENIREYLGSAGSVNKKIKETLKDPADRINFVYYNNGITMIVNDIRDEQTKGLRREFKVDNPQIVNGCQTVSTIFETLDSLPTNSLEHDFSDTYVMVKILKIPDDNQGLSQLKDLIVTYNNSQNAINQKTFVANNTKEFRRVQTEFERKGMLVCIKQSDKFKFKEKYKTVSKLTKINSEMIDRFGIEKKESVKDFYVDLEKLLQVILAYCGTTQSAVQKKSRLLKVGSDENRLVIDFIKNPDVTINSLINLYLLYMRAEQEKKKSADGRMPIPLYLIHCFARYECGNNPNKIDVELDSKEKVDRIIMLYKAVLKAYYSQWKAKPENDGKEYNTMIKSPMDNDLMDLQHESLSGVL